MIRFRDRNLRGRSHTGWLDSRHSFSFADYSDPQNMGLGNLRVINDDTVAPGAGFPTHAHANMDILTWVIRGGLEHKDSTGAGGVIGPGDLQRMSAGPGVRHSEFNASTSEPVRFLQIWLIPDQAIAAPIYQQVSFDPADLRDRLKLVAARGDAPVGLESGSRLHIGRLAEGVEVSHPLEAGREAWVQVATGIVKLQGGELREGDGAALTEEAEVRLTAETDAEVLVFDLPA
jgi:redox-sensitive bicupin YhaK (pirin superfamily)